MTNPFEDDSRIYVVLCNNEEQYSLWPANLDVPAGWTVVHSEDTRQACQEYIEQSWTDMRPRSLWEASRAAVAVSLEVLATVHSEGVAES